MSDFLFPRAAASSRAALERKLAALAVLLLVVFAGFSTWLGASFVGLVGGDVVATARVVSLGDSLGVNSSVKFRGLRVGRVVSVDGTRGEDGFYSARVIIDEAYASRIPGSVVARVLPGTLFGAEYVDLRGPQSAPGIAPVAHQASLQDGAVLKADTSREAVRLMDTFSALHRVISAVDPAAMDLAMSQLAGALDGRGDDLRSAVGRVSSLVDQYAGAEPTLYRDLDYLSTNLDTLAAVEPDIAAALRNSLPVAQTITAKAERIDDLLVAMTTMSSHVSAFLEKNGPKLDRLLGDVAPTYRQFVIGRDAFASILRLAPPVLRNGADAIHDGAIAMAAKFSAQMRDPYTAADCPRYGSLRGGNCR